MENNNVEKKDRKKTTDKSEGKNEKVSSPKKVAKKSVSKQSTTKKRKQEIKPIISETEDIKNDASMKKTVKKTVSSATKKASTKDTSKRDDRLEDTSRNKMEKSVTLKSSKEVKDDGTKSIDAKKSVKKSSSVRSTEKNAKELPKEANIRKNVENPSKAVRTIKSESSLSDSSSTKQSEKKPSKVLNSKKSDSLSTTTKGAGQSSKKVPTKKQQVETVQKSRASANKISSKGTAKAIKKSTEESTGVKKRISQNVEKATSEKSGTIKINRSGNSSKKNSVGGGSSSGVSEKKVNNKKVKDQEPIDEYDKDINISFLDDEFNEKLDINKLNQELKNRRYVSMEDNMSIVKNSFYNIIFAVVFILFLVFCNYGYYNIEKVAMIKNVNLFSYIFLIVSIMLIESAYKEEKLNKCINGLETLAMGIFTLFIPYMLQKYTSNFVNALITSGIVIFLYYIIKSIVVFFSNRSKFIRDKDDVSKDNEDGALYFDEEDDDIYD